MKIRSLPAMILAAFSISGFNLQALGHGGSSGGGGHFGSGGHFGGGHFGGGFHGGRFRGYYGGYGGWWDGGPWYPYDDWGYGYGYGGGYPDNEAAPMYYPQPNPARYVASLSREVQQSLAQAGYYRGDVDGHIGPLTRTAIGRYQRAHRLPVTDRIDESLLQSLGLL